MDNDYIQLKIFNIKAGGNKKIVGLKNYINELKKKYINIYSYESIFLYNILNFDDDIIKYINNKNIYNLHALTDKYNIILESIQLKLETSTDKIFIEEYTNIKKFMLKYKNLIYYLNYDINKVNKELDTIQSFVDVDSYNFIDYVPDKSFDMNLIDKIITDKLSDKVSSKEFLQSNLEIKKLINNQMSFDFDRFKNIINLHIKTEIENFIKSDTFKKIIPADFLTKYTETELEATLMKLITPKLTDDIYKSVFDKNNLNKTLENVIQSKISEVLPILGNKDQLDNLIIKILNNNIENLLDSDNIKSIIKPYINSSISELNIKYNLMEDTVKTYTDQVESNKNSLVARLTAIQDEFYKFKNTCYTEFDSIKNSEKLKEITNKFNEFLGYFEKRIEKLESFSNTLNDTYVSEFANLQDNLELNFKTFKDKYVTDLATYKNENFKTQIDDINNDINTINDQLREIKNTQVPNIERQRPMSVDISNIIKDMNEPIGKLKTEFSKMETDLNDKFSYLDVQQKQIIKDYQIFNDTINAIPDIKNIDTKITEYYENIKKQQDNLMNEFKALDQIKEDFMIANSGLKNITKMHIEALNNQDNLDKKIDNINTNLIEEIKKNEIEILDKFSPLHKDIKEVNLRLNKEIDKNNTRIQYETANYSNISIYNQIQEISKNLTKNIEKINKIQLEHNVIKENGLVLNENYDKIMANIEIAVTEKNKILNDNVNNLNKKIINNEKDYEQQIKLINDKLEIQAKTINDLTKQFNNDSIAGKLYITKEDFEKFKNSITSDIILLQTDFKNISEFKKSIIKELDIINLEHLTKLNTEIINLTMQTENNTKLNTELNNLIITQEKNIKENYVKLKNIEIKINDFILTYNNTKSNNEKYDKDFIIIYNSLKELKSLNNEFNNLKNDYKNKFEDVNLQEIQNMYTHLKNTINSLSQDVSKLTIEKAPNNLIPVGGSINYANYVMNVASNSLENINPIMHGYYSRYFNTFELPKKIKELDPYDINNLDFIKHPNSVRDICNNIYYSFINFSYVSGCPDSSKLKLSFNKIINKNQIFYNDYESIIVLKYPKLVTPPRQYAFYKPNEYPTIELELDLINIQKNINMTYQKNLFNYYNTVKILNKNQKSYHNRYLNLYVKNKICYYKYMIFFTEFKYLYLNVKADCQYKNNLNKKYNIILITNHYLMKIIKNYLKLSKEAILDIAYRNIL